VTLVDASVEDTSALTRALQGATSLFAMTTPAEGMDVETRQGISAVNAAKEAGVHLVFNSVASANRQTGIPHFESKYAVEEHIAKVGVRATVVAPVAFMENLIRYGKDQLAKGVYASPLPSTRKLEQVAVADIAAVDVRVLEDASRFIGRRIEVAGDDLTGDDAVAVLSRVTGRPFTYFQVPPDAVRQQMGDDAAKMYEWFEQVGYAVDRDSLRREFPDVAFHDFESWAKTHDWKKLLQDA
jgi:uncharacterized protein YbjT (DUF2867 family)